MWVWIDCVLSGAQPAALWIQLYSLCIKTQQRFIRLIILQADSRPLAQVFGGKNTKTRRDLLQDLFLQMPQINVENHQNTYSHCIIHLLQDLYLWCFKRLFMLEKISHSGTFFLCLKLICCKIYCSRCIKLMLKIIKIHIHTVQLCDLDYSAATFIALNDSI